VGVFCSWYSTNQNLFIFADSSIFLLTQRIFAVDSELKISYRSLLLTINNSYYSSDD